MAQVYQQAPVIGDVPEWMKAPIIPIRGTSTPVVRHPGFEPFSIRQMGRERFEQGKRIEAREQEQIGLEQLTFRADPVSQIALPEIPQLRAATARQARTSFEPRGGFFSDLYREFKRGFSGSTLGALVGLGEHPNEFHRVDTVIDRIDLFVNAEAPVHLAKGGGVGGFIGGVAGDILGSFSHPYLVALSVWRAGARKEQEIIERTGNAPAALTGGTLESAKMLLFFKLLGKKGSDVGTTVGQVAFRKSFDKAAQKVELEMNQALLTGQRQSVKNLANRLFRDTSIGMGGGLTINESALVAEEFSEALFGTKTFAEAITTIGKEAGPVALESVASGLFIGGFGALGGLRRARTQFKRQLANANTTAKMATLRADVRRFVEQNAEARQLVANASPETLAGLRRRFSGKQDIHSLAMLDLIDARLKEPIKPQEEISVNVSGKQRPVTPEQAQRIVSTEGTPSRNDLRGVVQVSDKLNAHQRVQIKESIQEQLDDLAQRPPKAETKAEEVQPQVQPQVQAQEAITKEPTRAQTIPRSETQARPEEGRQDIRRPGQVQEGAKPTRQEPKAQVAPQRRGLIDLDPLIKTVQAGLKVGKWSIDHTRSAARWLWYVHGGDVKRTDALKAIVAKFGAPIKQRFPRIWAVFSRGLRGIGDFFAGPKDVSRAATKPAPVETVVKFAKAVRSAKPHRREFEALKLAERAKRGAVMRTAQEKVGGEQALFRSLAAQKGEFERPAQAFEPIGDQFTQAERDALMDHIWSHPVGGAPQARMGIANVLRGIMDYGQLPTDGEIQTFELLFGSTLARALLAKRFSALRRGVRFALDVANIPRALVTSWDISATLRQGGPLAYAHPLIAKDALVDEVRAFASESYATEVDLAFRGDNRHWLREKAGLFTPPVTGTSIISQREEVYQSTLIQKIPILRVLVRPSERAYLTFLNVQRVRVFDLVADELQRLGRAPETHMNEYKAWANTINAGTGRGNIDLGDLNVALNALFFSVRLQYSRFEYPLRQLERLIVSRGRKIAARQIVAQVMVPLTVLAFLHFWSEWDDEMDARVEYDPRSTDFGRIQIGERTSWDITSGFGSSWRGVAQIATATRKRREDQRIIKADRWFTAKYWLKPKLAPTPTAFLHIFEGERFGGKPLSAEIPLTDIDVPYLGVAADLTVPITFQQIEEALNEHGLAGLSLLVPEIFGQSVNIRPEQEPTRRKLPSRPTKRPSRPRSAPR